MIKQEFNPVAKDTRQFIQFCKRLENSDLQDTPTMEPQMPTTKKAYKNKKKRSHKNDTLYTNIQAKTASKRYDATATCLLHGVGHSTNDCTIIKAHADRMKATYKAQDLVVKQAYKKKQELHAFVANEVEKHMMNKKCRIPKKKRKPPPSKPTEVTSTEVAVISEDTQNLPDLDHSSHLTLDDGQSSTTTNNSSTSKNTFDSQK